MQKPDIWAVAAGLTLLAGFGFMGTAPFIASYVVIVGGLIGLGLALRERSPVLRHPAAMAIYLALALIAITLPFVYRDTLDLLPLAASLPLLAAPGIAALIDRRPAFTAAHMIPLLCLFGAATAAAFGAWEFYVSAVGRAGVGNNPIHYGGIATILGFMALTGAVSNTERWRLVYLLGPAMALLAVVASGSRGPMLAWAALALVSLPVLIVGLKHRGLTVLTLLVAIAGFSLFLVLAQETLVVQRIAQVFDQMRLAVGSGDFGALFGNDPARVAMYDTGWQALLSSPIVGVGFGQLMPLSRELHPIMESYLSLEHLHSDIADFAGASGILGVAALVLITAAPLLVLTRRAARKAHLVLGALVLVVGYATQGLTNAMFGVLPQTALYAIGLAYLIAASRRASASD